MVAVVALLLVVQWVRVVGEVGGERWWRLVCRGVILRYVVGLDVVVI